MSEPDSELVRDNDETTEEATVEHEIEDRADPDSLIGEEVDDDWLWPVEDLGEYSLETEGA